METESIHWQHIGKPGLFRYRDHGAGQVALPVLMVDLAEENPHLWNLLGVYFMGDGFRHVYACRLPDEQPLPALKHVVKRVLAMAGASWLVMLAYDTAAAHALHYIEGCQGYKHVHMFVGLNGQYERNALSYLGGTLLQRDEGAAPVPQDACPGGPELVNQFIMLNIYGQAPTSYLNPDRVVMPLPEAINVGMNLHPSKVMHSPEVYETLWPYLHGEVWIVQFHLSGFQMRLGAPGVPIGRFYFEVEGQRVPPDGVFAPPDQADYTFDNFTPLGAIALQAKPGLQAANVNFRMREAGRAAPERRKLTTKLHIPLINGAATDYHMQDSFGSEIRLRVHCLRAPRIVPSENDRRT